MDRFGISRPIVIFRISPHVGDVNGSTFQCGARGRAVPAEANWVLLEELLELWQSIVGHRHAQQLAIETENESAIGLTEPDGIFGHSFKYRLEIERRSADDVE